MAVFTALAIGGYIAASTAVIGAAVVYGGYAVDQSIKSSKAAGAAARSARSASEIQIKQQKENAKQARRSAVRSSIIARSQGTTAAEAGGTLTSSGFQGGISSLSSQLGTNLGFGSMMSGLGENYTAMSGLAAQQSAESAMFGAKANLGFNLMQIGMGAKGPSAPIPTDGGGGGGGGGGR